MTVPEFQSLSSRNPIFNAERGVAYPSPFFDVASTYIPRSVRALYRWCDFYFRTNPLINAVCTKLAEYPITDITLDSPNDDVRKRWETFLFDQLQYKSFEIGIGLDYHVFGIAFAMFSFPFRKLLACGHCGHEVDAQTSRKHWRYAVDRFLMLCPKCGRRGRARPRDRYVSAVEGIRLLRRSPLDIDVRYHEESGWVEYVYNPPADLRADIVSGKKHVVVGCPQELLEAVRLGRSIRLNPDNLFCLKRTTCSTREQGLGSPVILPVLKDTFYLQILKKAQEALSLGTIIPLRIFFPQAGGPMQDPVTNVNLTEWRDMLEEQLRKFRNDPLYCIAPDTLIVTPRGLRRADMIAAGDRVRDHLGNWSRVMATARRAFRADEKAYRLNVRGLRAVRTIFSENHRIWGLKTRGFSVGYDRKHLGKPAKKGCLVPKPEFLFVKDLEPGDYVGYPVRRDVVARERLDLADWTTRACTPGWVYVDHTTPAVPQAFEYLEVHGPSADRSALLEERGWTVNEYKIAQIAWRESRCLRRLPRYMPFDSELAWIVGIYLAEGSTTDRTVLFSLNKDEMEYAERIQDFFADRFNTSSSVVPKEGNGVQVVVSSRVGADFFGALCSGNARCKQVPGIYLMADGEIVRALLRGLFDGDGCYHEKNGSSKVTLKLASRQLVEDARFLLLSLGLPGGITFEPGGHSEALSRLNGKPSSCHDSYRLQVNLPGAEFKAFLEGAMIRPDWHPRIGFYADGWFWHRIDAVEPVPNSEVPEVVDFQVDPTHSFCTWGVATHNSPILPFPVGHQLVGGEGRALLLSQEIRIWSDQIILGMGYPPSLIFGDAAWSGQSVNLRLIENSFLRYMEQRQRLMQFVTKTAGKYLHWELPDWRMKPFKMADDVQRQNMAMTLNQMGKLSDETMLSAMDYDPSREEDVIAEERKKNLDRMTEQGKAAARAQGESMLIQAEYQAKAAAVQTRIQQAEGMSAQVNVPGASGGPQGIEAPDYRNPYTGALQGLDARVVPRKLAEQIASLPPDQKNSALLQIQATQPELYYQVVKNLAPVPSSSSPGARSLPEQRPPRAGPATAVM